MSENLKEGGDEALLRHRKELSAWRPGVLTGVTSRSTDRGTACSRPDDLGSGLQSIRGGTCHSGGPRCGAGSSAAERAADGSQRADT